MLYLLVQALAKSLGIQRPAPWKQAGGAAKCGVLGRGTNTIEVDTSKRTDRKVACRRPDAIVTQKEEKRILILDVAVPWEPNVTERQLEKEMKYQELAADLSKTKKSRVWVIPVVVGTMGLMCGLEGHLARTELWDKKTIQKLAASVQREAICGSACTSLPQAHVCVTVNVLYSLLINSLYSIKLLSTYPTWITLEPWDGWMPGTSR